MMKPLEISTCLPFDMKGEVLAYLLSKNHDLSLEQILFQPTNFFQRQGRKDVLDISEGFSFNLDKKTILLELCREGFYDTLPEGIFLHPEENFGDGVDYSKRLAEQEQRARKFLLPFEQLFYWLRLENEEREFEMESGLEHWWQEIYQEKGNGLVHANPFLTNKLLSQSQKAVLIQLIPHLAEIVGNWDLVRQCLSRLLEAKVDITVLPLPVYPYPEDLQTRMGNGILGEDFVIGDTFSDGVDALDISISNLTPNNLADFLTGGDKRTILEKEFLPLFLPVEISYEITTALSINSSMFQLGSIYDSSILGYTTTLEN